MAFADLRGNPCSSADRGAHAALESALWRMMSFYDTPLADLDRAAACDPDWILPELMRAGFWLGLTEPGQLIQARAHLDKARRALPAAVARERAHFEALQAVLAGRWQRASRIWDELLIDHPTDALALQWAQSWDFYCGDLLGLRQRPARALPQWDESDPLFAHVLALYAFGLEENNLYSQAEEVGRRALSLQPQSPWAIHAVAHVMEMQGRFEEGASWLRGQQPLWAEGNGFATHLWWHKTLFRLEAMDKLGALRLIDAHFQSDTLEITLQRVDAASLLWRLHLLGEDMSAQCAALIKSWPLEGDDAGYYAFNDVHAVMALLGADEIARAESWLARCAKRALDPADAARSNHDMARGVGLPLMRGLIALRRGDANTACDLLSQVRSQAQRLGGSHAQRDFIDQTLMAAAARSGRRSLGQALLNERCMAKAQTPLTRHWIEQLDSPGLAGA